MTNDDYSKTHEKHGGNSKQMAHVRIQVSRN